MPPKNIDKFSYSDQYKKQAEERLKEIREHKAKLKELERIVKIEVLGVGKLHTKWVIMGSAIIVLIVLWEIFMLAIPNNPQFLPLDISIKNETIDSSISYKGSQLLSITGFESILETLGESDVLFGKKTYKQIIFDESGKAYTVTPTSSVIMVEPLKTNPEKVTKIGWFYEPERIEIKEYFAKNSKKVEILLESDELSTSINYNFYKRKPYLLVNFLSKQQTQNFAYGLVMNSFDIYLPTGKILENDNEIIKSGKAVNIILREGGNETTNVSEALRQTVGTKVDTSIVEISRNGSTYEVTADYELFFNPETKIGIVIYSLANVTFKNYFYWEVFQVYVPHFGEGKYPPLYVIVIENPDLSYDEEVGDWYITSEQYTGYTWDYIHQVVWEVESGEAGKFKFRDYLGL